MVPGHNNGDGPRVTHKDCWKILSCWKKVKLDGLWIGKRSRYSEYRKFENALLGKTMRLMGYAVDDH